MAHSGSPLNFTAFISVNEREKASAASLQSLCLHSHFVLFYLYGSTCIFLRGVVAHFKSALLWMHFTAKAGPINGEAAFLGALAAC
jgi:hypothetical protein